MAKKRMLITGGLGFIGSNLIKQLDLEKYHVTVLDNLSNTAESGVESIVDVIEGDIRNENDVARATANQNIVVHLAAHTRVIDSIEDPALNFDINVRGTFNVLEGMRKNGVMTIVNASTGGAILGEVEPPVHEGIVANPAAPYGASKLAAEGYCSAYSQSYGMQALSLRFSNIYGRYSRNKASVVAAFIKAIVKDRSITIYGDGTQIRDYLFVDDLAHGIVQAIESGVSGVYQLGSGIPTDLNTLVELMRSVLPYDFKVANEDFRAGELRHTYCNIDKAAKAFGFSPATNLPEGIRLTWTWFKEEGLDK